MTDGLKPCPFCGGEAKEIEPSNTCPWWEIQCKKCFANIGGTHREKNREAWNTRYKLTCKNLHPDTDISFICSECSALVRSKSVGESTVDENGVRWYSTSMKHNFNVCPNCGADVVDD